MTGVHPHLTLAALVADPPSASESAVPPVDGAEDFTALLRRNRVSLLGLSGAPLPLRALLKCGPLAARRADEERAFAHIRAEYARVKAAFTQAGIQDVLIKAVGVPPSFPHLSDNIDDLVPAQQIPAARAALVSLGYVELRNLEEPCKFFFKRFSAGEEVAAFHLHEHIGWAVSFLDEETVLRRVQRAPDDPDLLIPHPEDSLLITMAHAFYENKAVKVADVARVRQCLRLGSVDWEGVCARCDQKGWLDGLNVVITLFAGLETQLYGDTSFPPTVLAESRASLTTWQARHIAFLYARPLTMPLPVGFVFSKRLFYRKALRDRTRPSSRKLHDVVRHTLNGARLKLRTHSQPGVLVSFSGVDGSGKSRHAHALYHAFEQCDIPATYVWSRAGSSPLTDALFGVGKFLLRRQRTEGATQVARSMARRQMVRNPLVRWAWQALVAFDLIARYFLRVQIPLLFGRAVICDRYTYDAIADVAMTTGQPRSLFATCLTLLCPRPSAAYVLSIPVADAVTRRQDEGLPEEYLTTQASLYAAVAERYRLIPVDSSRSFEEANDPVVRDVLARYFGRYRTVINALFMSNPKR